MKKDEFRKAIDTLKLYRRAELLSEAGKAIITDLYVDPLPNDHILNTVLKNNTSFLIGRKGTGKSTIFQRAQEELNKNNTVTWAYIDIKTLYESSVTEIIGSIPQNHDVALNDGTVRKIYIFKNFVIELITEIKKQIKVRISSSLFSQLKEALSGDITDLFEKLDEFVEELKNDQYLNITGTICASKQDEDKQSESSKLGAELSAKYSLDPSIKANLMSEILSDIQSTRSQNYSQVFIRVFRIRELISQLREILLTLKVKHLYIFIDDFSELPRLDMEQVVDTILAPFNNWSDEFIKLKIAVYPGRLYAGDIDISKVDEVYLDIYKAYGQHDVASMEDKAIDFTRRLVTTRINYFCKEDPEIYFDTTLKDLWLSLYYACLGNPRILGYILFYCYETSIIFEKRIGVKTIQDASRRYYEDKISQYFRLHKFQHESFEERSSIYSLRELLEEIVKQSKELRTYKGSKVIKDIDGRPPTSHFHVIRDYDQILSTLELNFFITKYYEMKDRDGREVSIYALNYGLCHQESISFGRPSGKREYRLYYIERIFDFNPIISTYIKGNQEIICNNCGKKHDPEMLKILQAYGMLCPECKKGTCTLVNISRKYENLIVTVKSENLLPEIDLGILKTLHDERKEMYAKELAGELDCSYQLIGKRGRILNVSGLLDRDEDEKRRRVFKITDLAQKHYFIDSPDDKMNFEVLNKS